MSRSFFTAFVVLFIGALPLTAVAQSQQPAPSGHDHGTPQHEHPTSDAPAQTPSKPAHDHPAPEPGPVPAAGAQHEHQHGAAGASLFSGRESSGTAWLPDATPMHAFHRQAGAWEVMLHGNAFVQLLHEAAPEDRGDTQAGSINWAMLMGRRPIGDGRFGVRGMVSLEPWTIRGCGYPNLLATGEVCEGHSIHDRQHPHDLIMEAAAEYDRPLRAGLRWQVYGGLAGEPALGPPAFPHRTSAMANPLSPIVHHWLDATHISYGVVTTGVYTSLWKLEASAFNGREPDEERADLDLDVLDSFAGRLTVAPSEALTLQVSAGWLHDAEPGDPGGPRVDVTRAAASATHHHRFGSGHLWATTVGWGANREEGEMTHGVLVESSASFADRQTWFGRIELNGKPAHALDLVGHEVFTVGKVQVGYARYFDTQFGLQPGIGGSVSASFVPAALKSQYGGRAPLGVGLFITFRPPRHTM